MARRGDERARMAADGKSIGSDFGRAELELWKAVLGVVDRNNEERRSQESPPKRPPLETEVGHPWSARIGHAAKKMLTNLLGERARIDARRGDLEQLSFTDAEIRAIRLRAPDLDVVVLLPTKGSDLTTALGDLCTLRDFWNKPSVMKYVNDIIVACSGDTADSLQLGK